MHGVVIGRLLTGRGVDGDGGMTSSPEAWPDVEGAGSELSAREAEAPGVLTCVEEAEFYSILVSNSFEHLLGPTLFPGQ